MDTAIRIFFALAAIFAVVVIWQSIAKAMRKQRFIRQRLDEIRFPVAPSDKPKWDICRPEVTSDHEHEWVDHWQFGASEPDEQLCRICGKVREYYGEHSFDDETVERYRQFTRDHLIRPRDKEGNRIISPLVEAQIEGEPLSPAQMRQPNVGGTGHPDYRGPNYVDEHEIVHEMKGTIYFDTPDGDE